jgi:small subunit ribosomal protein S6
MRRYETIFIIRPSAGEEDINRIIETTRQIIVDEKGSIIEMTRWGMKKLAYLIKKESLGFYVFCDFAGTPAAVAEIERKFRIEDLVLKYLTIKTADSIKEEEIAKAVLAAEQKKTIPSDSQEDEGAAVLETEEADEE